MFNQIYQIMTFDKFCDICTEKFGTELIPVPHVRDIGNFGDNHRTPRQVQEWWSKRRETIKVDKFGNKPKYKLIISNLEAFGHRKHEYLCSVCTNGDIEEELGHIGYEEWNDGDYAEAYNNVVTGIRQDIYYQGPSAKRACNALLKHIENGDTPVVWRPCH